MPANKYGGQNMIWFDVSNNGEIKIFQSKMQSIVVNNILKTVCHKFVIFFNDSNYW